MFVVLPIRSRVACRYCVFVCCMFRKELVRCPQAVFFVKSFLSLLYEFKSWFSVEVVSYDLPLRTRKQLVPILSLCLLLSSYIMSDSKSSGILSDGPVKYILRPVHTFNMSK